MSKLGALKTAKTSIGTAELRVGPLASAMRLGTTHSVGLIDDVTVDVAQTSVDLMGQFPQTAVQNKVVEQNISVRATTRERTRRNLKLMMGMGVGEIANDPTAVSTTMTTTEAKDSKAITVTSGTGFAEGDFVHIWRDGYPETVTVDIIDAIATNDITLTFGLVQALDGTAYTVKVAKSFPLAIGSSTATQYFAATVLQEEHSSNNPLVFHFWKTCIGSGMSLGTSATNFASINLDLKVMRPFPSEYEDSGGSLYHLTSVIDDNPYGIYVGGAD